MLAETASAKPESKGRLRFKKWLVRFGVPGASILGPLAIPTQFTAAMLVAAGTPRGWVLLWQAVAIVLWTTVATISIWAALTFVVGVSVSDDETPGDPRGRSAQAPERNSWRAARR